MSDIGRSAGAGAGAGARGRGRTRGEPSAPAPPPGAPEPSDEDLGRRGVVGRRAGAATTTTPPDKAQRGSPADSGSPPTERLAELELVSLAGRPGYGSLGRKYRVNANHFEIRFQQKVLSVNHYHVEISHSKIKLTRDDNRPIFWTCLTQNASELGLPNRDEMYKIAFDGVSNCYTLNPLQLPRENMKKFVIDSIVSKSDKPQKIDVLIQLVGPQLVDMRTVTPDAQAKKILTPIQILDIIIRQYRSNPVMDFGKSFYPFRNSIFMIPGTADAPGGFHVGGGREIWKGLFTSAHVGQNFKAMVNMDVDHTVFYKCSNGNGNGQNGAGAGRFSAIEFLCCVLNESDGRQNYDPRQISPTTALGESQCRAFEREIKGMRVCIDYNKPNTTNPNREYRVIGVDKSAIEITFPDRDGQQTNVAEYFKKTYTALRFPRMPTLKVGSKQKPIHLPIEHCYLARNQRVPKKLTENQTSQMIRQVCMPPADRQRSVEQMSQLARFNEDPFLRNFGIQVAPQMMQVDSRILPQPALAYAQGAPVQPRDGVWRAQNVRFHLPSTMKGLAVVAFSNPPQNTGQFIAELLGCCKQFGMTVPNPNQVFYHMEPNNSPQRFEMAFNTVLRTFKERTMELSLIMVVLPSKPSPLYPDIKRVAEIQLGLMTQCVTFKTIGKFASDTLGNIAFKINMKLGGVNCVLKTQEAAMKCLMTEPTIVLGIDVTHPGPTEKRSPSIASVVGSLDSTFMRFAASVKVQKQRREHLVYLSEPVTERLVAFYRGTRHKPQRIIVYRDGVSEGEFRAVLHEELRGIREACLKIDPGFKPNITFIVVQKRHHTRLFPANPSDGCGKHKNVYPGTVLDTDILFHDEFSFYLCSHAGIQGTSRPTRYTILHDDNKLKADEVQLVTYYLTHCFSRCTRAVSIPGPVYYAHLACARAREHLKNIIGDVLSDSASSRSGDQGQSGSVPEEELIRAATVSEAVRTEMYFT